MSEPNDKMLDEYLRRDSIVSQRYRELDDGEIPRELDAAVLAQARAAVAQPRVRTPTWVKWGAPLALAACIVMAVTVVLEIGVQEQVRMPSPQLEPQSAAPASAPFIPAVPEPVADTPSQDAQTMSAAPEAVSPAFAPAPSADISAEQTAAQRRMADEPRERRAIEQASRAAEAERERKAPAELRAAAPPPAMRTMTSQRPLAAAPPTDGAAAQTPPRLAPEVWLERIRELRSEGKVLEADEQWREFIAVYPDYEVESADIARPSEEAAP